MAGIIIRALTRILSTTIAIRTLYKTKVPKNAVFFQSGFATLQLRRALNKHVKPGDKVLDMGTGALALLSIWLKKSKKNVKIAAADIYPEIVKSAKKAAIYNNADIEVFESDLFSNVKGNFDIIAFNPPLQEKLTYTSVGKFLRQAPEAKIIISSNKHYIDLHKLEKVIREEGYKIEETVKTTFNPANAYVIRRL